MKILKVAGIHCPKCVQRIDNALKEEGIAHEISLEEKTVSIDETKLKEALEVLDDLGFDAE